LEKLNPRWIQSFQNNHNIVNQTQTWKLMVSTSKQEYIECFVAFHLDVLKCQIELRKLDENPIENIDETHYQLL
jgi:hypothetical protein